MRKLLFFLLIILECFLFIIPSEALSWPKLFHTRISSDIASKPFCAFGEPCDILPTTVVKVAGEVSDPRYFVQPHFNDVDLEILRDKSMMSQCFEKHKHVFYSKCENLDALKLDFDKFSSHYGALLGLCELEQSGFQMPPACEAFSTNSNRDSQQLQQCLKILRKEPQSWTSYSNQRQIVHRLCESHREPIERERTLNTTKKLFVLLDRVQESFNWDLEQHKTNLGRLYDLETKILELFPNLNKLEDTATMTNTKLTDANSKFNDLELYLASLESTSRDLSGTIQESLELVQSSYKINSDSVVLSKSLSQQLDTISARVKRLDFQQALSEVAHYSHWLAPWIQETFHHLKLKHGYIALLVTAAGAMLYAIPPSLWQDFVGILHHMYMYDLGSCITAASGGGLIIILVWTYRYFNRSSNRRLKVPRGYQQPRTPNMIPENVVSPVQQPETLNNWPNIPTKTVISKTPNSFGLRQYSVYRTRENMGGYQYPKLPARSVSLEPEVCNYFRTSNLD